MATPKKTAAAAQTSDESLATQIATETEAPIERPADAPSLRPWSTLTRRQRAEFQASSIGGLPMSTLVNAEDGRIDMAGLSARDFFMLTADVQDALAELALDKAAFVAWAESVDDDTLMQLFSWYRQQQASGE